MQFEREKRGWGYELLAQRLTEVGCPMSGSSLHKIEKGNPRRGISVDEAVAMRVVFDLSWERLLSPVEETVEDRADSLFEQWTTRISEASFASTNAERVEAALYKFGKDHPEARARLNRAIQAWLSNFTEPKLSPYGHLDRWLRASKPYLAHKGGGGDVWAGTVNPPPAPEE
jgi:transcriptional regulator with XRE-family HTH domain